MKKAFLFFAGIITAIMLASCASSPKMLDSDELAAFELPQNPTEKDAMVYIVRPSKVGFAVVFKVYVDEKSEETFQGSTKGGQYIYFSVQPGSRVIISQAESKAEYTFTAEANKTYYIQQTPLPGLLKARNTLSPLDEALGKSYVKKLKQGNLNKR